MIGGAQRPDGPHGRASNPHPEPTEPNQPNRSKPPNPPTRTGQPVWVSRSGTSGPGGLVQGHRFERAGCGDIGSGEQVRVN